MFPTMVSAVQSLVVCLRITSAYICAVSHAIMDDSIAEVNSADVIVSDPGRLNQSSCGRKLDDAPCDLRRNWVAHEIANNWS